MFETVGVMAVSACILQMVYEKIEKQRPVVDYTEENKKFREQKEQEAKEWSLPVPERAFLVVPLCLSSLPKLFF